MAQWQRAFLGLGSNLQDPVAQLRRALCALQADPNLELLGVSPFYRSKALLSAVDAPAQPDYCNAVAVLRTRLSPQALLQLCLQIEQSQGRQRSEKLRWQARPLDLDVLCYANHELHSPELDLPHPQVEQRNFVLQPWADLSPEWPLPGAKSIAQAQKNLSAERLNTWFGA